jgi:dipeptidyl aminopeptidase/acylaminoacyl peptidase
VAEKNMLRFTSKVFSCLLLSVFFVGFSEQFVTPATSLVQSNGRTIAAITGKDLVHPTLSPDGKFLAYAEVLVQKGVENTAVRILNLETKKSILLIDDKTAAKYKTYSSFVSDMEWSRADRLSVTISDGDVDSTVLTFNPGTQKLIGTKFLEPGSSVIQQEKLVKQIRSVFPKVNAAALKSGIYRHQVLANGVVLIPGELFGQENNLWALDISKKSVEKLLSNQDPLAKPLLSEDNRLKVIYSSAQRTILMVYVHASYEQGNNPLYILENGRLRLSTVYQELYDVSVDANGDRIAYCYWRNGKRQIVVKSLK